MTRGRFREWLWQGTRDRTFRHALRRVDTDRSGAGTLLTEPVVIWYGTHRGEYDAFDPDQNMLGTAGPLASDDQAPRYELREAGGRLVLTLHVSRQLPRQPHAIFTNDGTLIADVRLPSWRRREPQELIAGNAVLGTVEGLRGRIRIRDRGGEPAATCWAYSRSSYRVAYVVEIEDHIAGALRSVAVAIAILHDWSRYMYEAGG